MLKNGFRPVAEGADSVQCPMRKSHRSTKNGLPLACITIVLSSTLALAGRSHDTDRSTRQLNAAVPQPVKNSQAAGGDGPNSLLSQHVSTLLQNGKYEVGGNARLGCTLPSQERVSAVKVLLYTMDALACPLGPSVRTAFQPVTSAPCHQNSCTCMTSRSCAGSFPARAPSAGLLPAMLPNAERHWQLTVPQHPTRCSCTYPIPHPAQLFDTYIETVWQKPEPPAATKGVVLIAHGCHHGAIDFWPQSESCPNCIGGAGAPITSLALHVCTLR